MQIAFKLLALNVTFADHVNAGKSSHPLWRSHFGEEIASLGKKKIADLNWTACVLWCVLILFFRCILNS